MIQCIFTLDYEIFGDGRGSLEELVFRPTEDLRRVFEKWDARFVNFVEVAELERIELVGADPAIQRVKQQVQDMHRSGYEIGLHLHPQWYNARYEGGRWQLDYTEYNLCTLAPARIAEIVQRATTYLDCLVDDPGFRPLSFRAGNWLFQPTRNAAAELAKKGFRIDSSVFKGGLQRNHDLDYRAAIDNGYYWRFDSDVTQTDASGSWLELPIHSELVAPWKMITAKRASMENAFGGTTNLFKRLSRVADFARSRYPLKLDFCRMVASELIAMMNRVIVRNSEAEEVIPIVAIGHSKDLKDLDTVDAFLSFLRNSGIPIVTFADIFEPILQAKSSTCSTARR